jgi:hypothetical protein
MFKVIRNNFTLNYYKTFNLEKKNYFAFPFQRKNEKIGLKFNF